MLKTQNFAIITLLIAFVSPVFAQEYVPGEVIVKFKKEQSGSPNFSSKAVGLSVQLKKSWSVLNMHHFQAKAGQQDVEQLVRQLRNDPNVEYAEPNYIFKKQSVGFEGERLSKSSAVSSLSSGTISASSVPSYYQSDAGIQVVETWSILAPTSSVTPVVAIIDTGLDYNHEVFTSTGAVWSNPGEIANNGIDDDQNGYIDDIRGWNFVANNNNPMDDEDHGTHVAGIVFGVSQDIFAATLSAAKIKIMPLKFLDSTGSGATSDAVEAIYYAIANGASVINASWGGGSYSAALQDAIVEAYNNQITFIAAAGNASNNNDNSPTYPANYNIGNLISIAATTDLDNMASFSNYGRSTVHIASPGVTILSTVPNDGYVYASGTSMAAPLVAGIVALMEREAGQQINGYQAGQILFSNNDVNVGNVNGKVNTNARVNVYKAVNYAKNNTINSFQPDNSSYSRSLASDSGGGGGGCGLVRKVAEGSSSDLTGRALLMLIVLSPFAVAFILKRRRKEEEDRRGHQRYNIKSEVRISVGDKELVGAVSSISLGGVKIDTEALLEKGGIVEMNIMSPDGKERVQVLGKVVWSQERKSYGVQFCDMAETQSSSITSWTKKLVRSS
jgi:subtilisin family serine protease